MEQERWLSKSEIGRRLGRNESVVRAWCSAFRDVIPRRSGPHGHPVYPLAVLQEIARMRSEKRSDREIVERLVEVAGGLPARPADFQTDVIARLEELRRLLEELLRRMGPGSGTL